MPGKSNINVKTCLEIWESGFKKYFFSNVAGGEGRGGGLKRLI